MQLKEPLFVFVVEVPLQILVKIKKKKKKNFVNSSEKNTVAEGLLFEELIEALCNNTAHYIA